MLWFIFKADTPHPVTCSRMLIASVLTQNNTAAKKNHIIQIGWRTMSWNFKQPLKIENWNTNISNRETEISLCLLHNAHTCKENEWIMLQSFVRIKHFVHMMNEWIISFIIRWHMRKIYLHLASPGTMFSLLAESSLIDRWPHQNKKKWYQILYLVSISCLPGRPFCNITRYIL